MILSKRHSYIFLHCVKTAGTSVSVSLARDLGPLDIQIGSLCETIDEGIRPTAATALRLATPRGSYKFMRTLAARKGFAESLNSGVKVSFNATFGRHPEHCRSRDLLKVFPEAWEKFYKFCIVRNPYDRAVSYYYWTTKELPERPTFSEFVRSVYGADRQEGYIAKFADNWPIYTINNEIAVDRVLRYESLVDDLRCVLKEIGVAWDGWMPNTKSETRQVRDYRLLYRDHDIETVAKFFRKEIEKFDYSFG